MTLRQQMLPIAQQAKAASRELARLGSDQKNQSLLVMADALETNGAAIKDANAQDLAAATQAGLSSAMLDRLQLDEKRILSMAKGLRDVAALPDPVGKVLEERSRPNGLGLQKVAVPFGVIVIIYESRPNVTADAAGLCFKSGNATILRGGKEALHSNRAIVEVLVAAAQKAVSSFPEHAVQVVPTTDRNAIKALLSFTEYVDLCIPRGGEGLIRAVARASKVPVIKHYKGVCHVYVDRDADLKMAGNIVVNAKVQRPAVCNAMETLLVDKAIAPAFLPEIVRRLAGQRVEIRAEPEAKKLLKRMAKDVPVKTATKKDWVTEYNDLILSIKLVDGLDAAIDHINQFGSAHSDAIVTGNEERARRFLQGVDAAAVYWNASTRFTDGAEFGMGAEIGISTDKIGARGPMGLEELTTYKWLGYGSGQIRT